MIENWGEFGELADEWNGLLERSQVNTIFLTWEWMSSWLQIHRNQITPFVVVARDDDGRLLGVAPLYFNAFVFWKMVKMRMLCVMGDYATGSEYFDFIVDAESEDEILRCMFKKLQDKNSLWDIIWIPKMASWNHDPEKLLSAGRDQGCLTRKRNNIFSSFNVTSDAHEYLGRFSRKHKEHLMRLERKINDLDVKISRCEKNDEFDEFLEDLFELNNKRWMQVNDPGNFVKRPSEKAFYKVFAKKALENKWLWLYRLQHNGSTKAIQIGYVYRDTFYQLQEGFDPAFHKGVGNALRLYMIRECCKRNIAEYDFLGGYTEHKRRWRAVSRNGSEILIAGKHYLARLLVRLGVWPTGRHVTIVRKIK